MGYSYEQLAQAAFDNDAQIDEGHSLDAIICRLDLDVTPVLRAAEQRALRMVISMRGPDEVQRLKDQAYARQWTVEKLSAQEKNLHAILMAVWIDGLTTLQKASLS